MKAIRTGSPASLDTLEPFDAADPGEPGPGEIRVALKASSLNYHDYAVVTGNIPTDGPRIPLSDGAGQVVAVGDGVSEFAAGDAVVSTFFTRSIIRDPFSCRNLSRNSGKAWPLSPWRISKLPPQFT